MEFGYSSKHIFIVISYLMTIGYSLWGRLFEHPASEWLQKLKLESWQEFLEAVYRNFDEDSINFAEMRKLLNKIKETIAYLAKREATPGSVIKIVAKNDDKLKTNVKSNAVIKETVKKWWRIAWKDGWSNGFGGNKISSKIHSPKIIFVIICYSMKPLKRSHA